MDKKYINKNEENVKQEIEVSFEGKNLTPFGGTILFRKFFDIIGLRDVVSRYLTFKKRKSEHPPQQLLENFLYHEITGVERISHIEVLRRDEVYKTIIGVNKIAHHNTFYRFLEKCSSATVKSIKMINNKLLHLTWNLKKPQKEITLDLDTIVIPVYGKQQKAKIGYNPKKKGRPSFRPMVCFIDETDEYINGKFREADTPDSNEWIGFFNETIRLLPPTIETVKIRGDAELYDGAFIETIESKNFYYAIKADITEPISQKLETLNYRDIDDNFSVSEFRYQPYGWKTGKRFVVVREFIPEKERRKQLTLFELGNYTYRVIVTNFSGLPEEVWRFYNKRGEVENKIKEIEYGFHLTKISSNKFFGNSAQFQIRLLAYNLSIWFKRFCAPSGLKKITINTLRLKFITLSAKLIRSARKLILALSENYPFKKEFKFMLKRIEYCRSP